MDRPGRPELRRTPELREKINAKIRKSRRVTQLQLSAQLRIGVATVNKFVRGLQYRKLCVKWVPTFLINEMKAAKKVAYEELLARYYAEGERFLKNIVTVDESWVSY
ncbi:hypothetical protein PGB90_006728 [Kerria lacca]